ncbi:hypothetical protein [Lentilactobacillus sp. Marseille-Q4993]|uniref:hypothetical protein n=1 Tax=Lentilactobacillus sp. Marseille-Q4993 TaxID=3039492 RepID=UPI0024BCCDD9|nr:hypothetical protein [Lentilactobacillus sp. Marseille-Q4993]
MDESEKMREFILSYLDTQVNNVNLKTVRQLIDFGKNNQFSAPSILKELLVMDKKHEGILSATFEIDYVDGVNLFNNSASHWLTDTGKEYFQKLKERSTQSAENSFMESEPDSFENEYDGYLNQLLSAKTKMQSEKDKITLQEFTLELRHLLTDNKQLTQNSLEKFQPFINRNWKELSTPMMPILVELSKRFLFAIN